MTIESKSMRWAWYVAQIEGVKNTKIYLEIQDQYQVRMH
jgi:hypothetical protein